MFTLDRLPDYKANLDDVLHVQNASDATPASFTAQKNFLSQLESQVCICSFNFDLVSSLITTWIAGC